MKSQQIDVQQLSISRMALDTSPAACYVYAATHNDVVGDISLPGSALLSSLSLAGDVSQRSLQQHG
jgi:hypothetical protein